MIDLVGLRHPDRGLRASRNGKPSAAGGFTLVELLVVIGIIAVLIGILLPVLGRARASARTVTCAARMRQLATGTLLYAHDNKGYLPPIAVSTDVDGRYERPVLFPRGNADDAQSAFLRKYMTKDTSKSYVCPELEAEVSFSQVQNYSYRYNRILCGDDLPKIQKPMYVRPNGTSWLCLPWRLTQIRQSSLVAMYMDSDLQTSGQGPRRQNCTFAQDATVAALPPGRRYHTPDVSEVVHQRKKIGTNTGTGMAAFVGINNVAYCDGSVRGVQVKTDKSPPRAWDGTYIEPTRPTAMW